MKKILILILPLIIFSCSATRKITQIDLDKDRGLYAGTFEGGQDKVFLRDDNSNLIRAGEDKDTFVSKYNNYWLLEEKYRTNEYYNNYYNELSQKEKFKYLDMNINYEYGSVYFSGVKKIKKSDYAGAIKDFDKLISLYPEIIKYSDILFLKARCYEMLGDKAMALSNYNTFVNQSVQRYSKLFSENLSENTNGYDKEILYSYGTISNSGIIFPEEILSNDIAKYDDGACFNSGFNYHWPNPNTMSFGLVVGYATTYGAIIGANLTIQFNEWFQISDYVYYSGYFIGTELQFPMQVYKSDDHKFGFEITPVFYYYHFSYCNLGDPNNLYSINDDYINFGIETSIGYFIFPSLSAGLSLYYSYYNQFNKYATLDIINGNSYELLYWNEMFYYLSLRYYFARFIAIEAGLKNTDFLVGLVVDNLYLGYDINQNELLLNYGTRF